MSALTSLHYYIQNIAQDHSTSHLILVHNQVVFSPKKCKVVLINMQLYNYSLLTLSDPEGNLSYSKL